MAQPDGKPAIQPTAAQRRVQRGHVATYGSLRPCSEPSCTAMLSRYNGGTRCWSHVETELERRR